MKRITDRHITALRRGVLITAGAVMLLCASCRDGYDTTGGSESPGPKQPIMLGMARQGTRGLVGSTGELALLCNSGRAIGVYAYKKTATGAHGMMFNNLELTSVTDDANPDVNSDWRWTYQPVEYWDRDPRVSYQFMAYWPRMGDNDPGDGGTYVSEDGQRVFHMHNIPNWQDTTDVNCTDYLSAQVRGQYRSEDTDNLASLAFGDGYVKLRMRHILSKLVVEGFYVGMEEKPIKIDSIKIIGASIPLTDGVSLYDEPFDGQANPSYTISRGSVPHMLYKKETPAADGLSLDGTYYDEETAPADPITKTICGWLVVPATGWGDITLRITYKIGNSAASYTSDVKGISFDSVDDNGDERSGEMLPGGVYILTLKFDSTSGGIDVQAVWVKDWQQRPMIQNIVYNW